MTDLANQELVTTPATPGERLAEIARRVGETVAGPAAYDVDLNARFPREAIDALRAEGVLSAIVPTELGGMGASISDVSNAVRIISRYCAATGCVLAMHTIEVFLLLSWGATPALRALVGELVERQLLIANANSEVGLGGDVARSLAALEPDGDGWRFDKQALAASYGRSADLISATIRRAPEAADTDQAFVIFRADGFTLEATSGWDTMGLRGTCSSGLHMTGHVTADDIYPVPFAEIGSGGGGQLRNALLSAVWVGLADAALDEAHAAVRVAARRSIGTTPLAAVRLAEMTADVQASRAVLAQALERIEEAVVTNDLNDIGLIMTLRNVKVVTATTAVSTATKALQVCGINGFRRGADHRLERVIRDAHGGLIMVSIDRNLNDNAQLLTVLKEV